MKVYRAGKTREILTKTKRRCQNAVTSTPDPSSGGAYGAFGSYAAHYVTTLSINSVVRFMPLHSSTEGDDLSSPSANCSHGSNIPYDLLSCRDEFEDAGAPVGVNVS